MTGTRKKSSKQGSKKPKNTKPRRRAPKTTHELRVDRANAKLKSGEKLSRSEGRAVRKEAHERATEGAEPVDQLADQMRRAEAAKASGATPGGGPPAAPAAPPAHAPPMRPPAAPAPLPFGAMAVAAVKTQHDLARLNNVHIKVSVNGACRGCGGQACTNPDACAQTHLVDSTLVNADFVYAQPKPASLFESIAHRIRSRGFFSTMGEVFSAFSDLGKTGTTTKLDQLRTVPEMHSVTIRPLVVPNSIPGFDQSKNPTAKITDPRVVVVIPKDTKIGSATTNLEPNQRAHLMIDTDLTNGNQKWDAVLGAPFHRPIESLVGRMPEAGASQIMMRYTNFQRDIYTTTTTTLANYIRSANPNQWAPQNYSTSTVTSTLSPILLPLADRSRYQYLRVPRPLMSTSLVPFLRPGGPTPSATPNPRLTPELPTGSSQAPPVV